MLRARFVLVLDDDPVAAQDRRRLTHSVFHLVAESERDDS